MKNLERAKNRQKAEAVRGQVSTYRENKEKRMLTQRKELQKQAVDLSKFFGHFFIESHS